VPGRRAEPRPGEWLRQRELPERVLPSDCALWSAGGRQRPSIRSDAAEEGQRESGVQNQRSCLLWARAASLSDLGERILRGHAYMYNINKITLPKEKKQREIDNYIMLPFAF